MSTDLSLAYKTSFVMSFARLPETNFFLQDLPIPAVNLGIVNIPTPRHDFPEPGDKLTFDPLTVSFLIDENYKNYIECFDWFISLRDPMAGNGENEQTDGDKTDATITILNNNNIPIAEVTFYDCFPTSLDGALFDVSAEDGADPQVANLTLEYCHYRIKAL